VFQRAPTILDIALVTLPHLEVRTSGSRDHDRGIVAYYRLTFVISP